MEGSVVAFGVAGVGGTGVVIKERNVLDVLSWGGEGALAGQGGGEVVSSSSGPTAGGTVRTTTWGAAWGRGGGCRPETYDIIVSNGRLHMSIHDK